MAKICVMSASAIPSPPPSYGAMEYLSWACAAEIAKGGHDVTFVAAKGSKKPNGCELVETVEPAYEGILIEERAWEAFSSSADLGSFDVLVDHSHFFSAYRWKQKQPDLGVVKVFHDLLPCLVPPPMDSYDELKGVSRFHSAFLNDQWGVDIGYLYNGVDLEQFPVSREKKDYALFLSRLSEGKGAHHFIEACERSGIHGIIAGEDRPEFGINPAYQQQLLRRCSEVGVEYMGPVDSDTRLRLMQEARVFCQPLDSSYREVFGMTYVESLACGTPVVTSDLGAGPEIVCPRSSVIEGLNPPVGEVVSGTSEKFDAYLSIALRRVYDAPPTPEICRRRSEMFSLDRFGEAYRQEIDRLVAVRA